MNATEFATHRCDTLPFSITALRAWASSLALLRWFKPFALKSPITRHHIRNQQS
jgi:hypothetical protein